MVVDDNPTNLKLIAKILEAEGYHDILPIVDSRKVISQYQESRPELILLDINMPHRNGFDVLSDLKSLDDPLLPPIVMLTAYHDREPLIKSLTLGARDYITKPFDKNELLIRVRNLLDAQLAHHLLHDQKSTLEKIVEERTRELRDTQLQVVQRLGKAAEYRDEETGNHILRMSHSCAAIAKKLGWSHEQCDLILNASPMHDIGKIGVPDDILLKPGKFEPHEWEIMKSHATIGAQLLEGDESELLTMARDIALNHHEKWDGSGYPNGLSGTDIPEAARIAALADVFDALTSIRPYKKAWTVDDAISFIKENSGTHFEPGLVEVFIEVLPEILEIKSKYSD